MRSGNDSVPARARLGVSTVEGFPAVGTTAKLSPYGNSYGIFQNRAERPRFLGIGEIYARASALLAFRNLL
jgi:hypothetical protein